MAGRGIISEELKNENNQRVLMLNKENQWVQAKHPLHFDKPAVVGVGPGLKFGITMAEARERVKIGLVPCAVGGTSIDLWIPGAYDSITRSHPYDDALGRIKTAMRAGAIKGVIWHQGESDSRQESANVYLPKLVALIQRIRVETNIADLPFVVGELGRFRENYASINKVMANLPGQVPYTAVATSEGLVHKGDTTHFDALSAEKLGERFAIKMQQVQKAKQR